MAVAHVSAHFQPSGLVFLFTVLPDKIHTGILVGHETAVAAPTSMEPAGEPAVVHIVGTSKQRQPQPVGKAVHHETTRIAVFRTVSEIYIRQPAFLHFRLHREVNHRFFFPVIDTCHARVVALTVVCLDFLYHVGRQVLHRHLGVVIEEFLAVYHDSLHFLSVDGDGSVL